MPDTVETYVRGARARHAKPYSVACELGLWSGISSYLVVPGLDARHREYIEADYSAAVERIRHEWCALSHGGRALGALVALHHEEMGAWYATSVACSSFHMVPHGGGRGSFLQLQVGMAADVLFRCYQSYEPEVLDIATVFLDKALREAGTQAHGPVAFPCHPDATVDLPFGASVLLKPTYHACPACGRRWAFERSLSHVAQGADFERVFARDASLLLTA